MSARLTLEYSCSRCPRVDSEEVSLEEAARLAKNGLKSGPQAMKVFVDGDEWLAFEHLCDPCRSAVMNYLKSATKELKHRSSVRDTDEENTQEE